MTARLASYLAIMPPQQRITSKDRLMFTYPLGEQPTHNEMFTQHDQLTHGLDNIYGYALTGIMSAVGASVAYGGEVSDDRSSSKVDDILAAAVACKPTIFSR